MRRSRLHGSDARGRARLQSCHTLSRRFGFSRWGLLFPSVNYGRGVDVSAGREFIQRISDPLQQRDGRCCRPMKLRVRPRYPQAEPIASLLAGRSSV
jgi:hypothetical protein